MHSAHICRCRPYTKHHYSTTPVQSNPTYCTARRRPCQKLTSHIRTHNNIPIQYTTTSTCCIMQLSCSIIADLLLVPKLQPCQPATVTWTWCSATHLPVAGWQGLWPVCNIHPVCKVHTVQPMHNCICARVM